MGIGIICFVLLLLAGLVTGIVFIVKGGRNLYRRQISQGVSYLLVGLALAICGALFTLTLTVVSFSSPSKNAMEKATRGTIANIRVALDIYKVDCMTFPREVNWFLALKTNLGVKGWDGPYIRAVPSYDAWGTPFRYTLFDGKPVVTSAGRDMEFDTADDITE